MGFDIPKGSWLAEWTKAWEYSEPPRSYILLAGLGALGAGLGRRCFLENPPHVVWPMLNILLIGPSGIGKSTSIGLLSGLMTGSTTGLQLVQGPASPEKLHEDLVANPHAVVVCSELANFFNKQKYMEGMIPYVTELLDNSPSGVERRTRSGGITRIPQPAVTVVGGSTPEWLQDQLPDSAGTGGFLARFLVCREDRKFRKLPLPSYTLGRQASNGLRHERSRVQAAFEHLVMQEGEVRFKDYEVADRFVELVNRRGNPKGFLAPFAAREVEFTLRLSMLSALARSSKLVNEEDVLFAGELFSYCYGKLGEVVVPFTPKGKLLKILLDLLGEKPLGESQIVSAMRNFTTAQEVQVLLGSLLIGNDIEKLKNGKYRRLDANRSKRLDT